MKCILSQPVHSDEAAHQLIQRLLVGDSEAPAEGTETYTILQGVPG